jgi:hypothetical protein
MSKSADERLASLNALPSTSHSTPKRSKASNRQWNMPSYKPIA